MSMPNVGARTTAIDPSSAAETVLSPAHRTEPSINQLVLENGLQVAWQEDHRQPLVAIEARIKGGLRGEGRYVGTGITHFIEHMLFKGTPSRPSGSIEQEVRRYGGTINAFTSFDVTGVSLFVEQRYVNEGLALVADILQHAVFDQTEFDKERAVIISEIHMNLDDPDRRLSQLFWSRHFLEHPYRHPILGYQSLLERLTVNDLTTFYAAQYQPQNVTVACVGDIDGAAMPQLMRSLFETWPRGFMDPQQRLVPVEPPAVSPKNVALELPVQRGYVALGFSSTRMTDPDTYALDVLSTILGQGRSSRLYETIVRKRHLAEAIAAWNYTPYDPGVFGIQFQTDPGQIPAATAAALEVLDDITQHGVTEEELQKAKHLTSAGYVFGLQTVEARAADLANSMAATGDPLFSRHYIDRIERITRAQVQAVARRYVDPSCMTTAIIRPAAALYSASLSPATAQPIHLTRETLPNGLTIVIGTDPTLPIATAVMAFRGGVRVQTESQDGVSNFVAQLLTKGTARKTAFAIAEQVESLGGALEPFSGRDSFGLSLQLLSGDLKTGLELLHELITQSSFSDQEVAIQRELIAKGLQSQEDEIFDVGGRLLRRTLFRRHPYRSNPPGEPATVRALTRQECLHYAKQWMAPSNATLAIFGDLDPVAVTSQIHRLFGSLETSSPPWPDHLPEETLEGVRQARQSIEKEQALIMLGFLGTTYTSPDRYVVDVMTAVLSGMAGRLFQAVREAHGLSYTLGAVHVPAWDPGYLLVYAATRPNEREKVLRSLREQLVLAAERGFTETEVAEAKRYLIGLHRMDVQHLIELAKRSALEELYRVGFDAWTQYEKQIHAVTLAMVNDAARRYLTIDRYAQVTLSPEPSPSVGAGEGRVEPRSGSTEDRSSPHAHRQ